MKRINRLKVVLVEMQKTGRWLVEQLGKDLATVLRWGFNSIHPSVDTFMKITDLLNVDMKDLFNSSK